MFRTLSTATLDLGLRVGILLALIAAADYAYQHWQYERDLRMSKDEVKEEQKLLEGNPEVEARIRRMQITLSRSRMLRNVKKADVVVRNPTHYAVALKYDPAKAAAPDRPGEGRGLPGAADRRAGARARRPRRFTTRRWPRRSTRRWRWAK